MDAQPHILVVDDDPEIRRLLGRYLDGQGLRVTLAANRHECEERLKDNNIALVVLDVMLPDGSGLEICRALSEQRPNLAIILLTALKEDVDRIIGLEIGADDYLGKPFNPRELVARIRAVLRRGKTEPDGDAENLRYAFADFVADPRTRTVTTPDGREVELTGGEFDLLLVFLERPGRILSRDSLLDLTRGRAADPLDRSVDVLLSRLRRKLGDQGIYKLFKTVRNGGYQLAVNVEQLRA